VASKYPNSSYTDFELDSVRSCTISSPASLANIYI